MAVCEVCGNDYDKPIEVSVGGGGLHTFDSFECAIHSLALEVPGTPDMPEVPEPSPPQEPGPGPGAPEVPTPDPKGPEIPDDE